MNVSLVDILKNHLDDDEEISKYDIKVLKVQYLKKSEKLRIHVKCNNKLKKMGNQR